MARIGDIVARSRDGCMRKVTGRTPDGSYVLRSLHPDAWVLYMVSETAFQNGWQVVGHGRRRSEGQRVLRTAQDALAIRPR